MTSEVIIRLKNIYKSMIKNKRRLLFILIPLVALILIGVLLVVNTSKHDVNQVEQKNDANAIEVAEVKHSTSYSRWPFPATTKLDWNHKYSINGIQYELISQENFGLTSPDDINRSAIPIIDIKFQLTNISGDEINYTSCWEEGASCTSEQQNNQDKVIESIDFGCLAQLTGGVTYQTIADDYRVYSQGGFLGDPTFPIFDETLLPNDVTISAAITPDVRTGTGGRYLIRKSIKFNVGETKTAEIVVSDQCVAVGAYDKSVFWPTVTLGSVNSVD